VTFRVKKTANFCQISNAALRDTRLSYCARGILAMVMTHSDEWKTSTNWLRENTQSEGKVAIGNAIKELKAAGYLKITPLYTDGRFNGHVWNWSDAPQQDDGQNSRNRHFRNEESRNKECIPGYQAQEHQEEEEHVVDAVASPHPPQELRSLKADPHSPTPNSAAPPSPCPPPKKPRPRDPIMDAIVTACGGDPIHQTASQWGMAAKAKKEILEVDPNVTPTAIIQFGTRKRREWKVASCTPIALTKHWESQQAGSPAASEDDPFEGKAVVTYQEVQDRFGEGPEAVRVCSMLESQGRLEW
jgi:hypothetical protein